MIDAFMKILITGIFVIWIIAEILVIMHLDKREIKDFGKIQDQWRYHRLWILIVVLIVADVVLWLH